MSSLVIIPPSWLILHETHPGVSTLARSYIWWLKLNNWSKPGQYVKSQDPHLPSPTTSLGMSLILISLAPDILHSAYGWAHTRCPQHAVDIICQNNRNTQNCAWFASKSGHRQRLFIYKNEELRSFTSGNGICSCHYSSVPSTVLAECTVQAFKNGLKRTPGATKQKKNSQSFCLHIELHHRPQQASLRHNYSCGMPSQVASGRTLP